MNKYTFDKYGFKGYLLKNLPETKQIDLIFWKNEIPMPVDLIYEIFEKRGILIKKYLDHIGAAFLFGYMHKAKKKDWKSELSKQPTEKNVKEDLIKDFKKYIESSGVRNLLSELAELLLIHNYQPDENDFAEAICHEGRKCKRLWLPDSVKDKIRAVFPELLEQIAISNRDMFSNVVADELNIYRMGFADAFAGIFNKLVEFILIMSTGAEKDKGVVNAAGYKIVQKSVRSLNNSEVVYDIVSDGSIWEPVYRNAKTGFILNTSHPYCEKVKMQGGELEKIFTDFIAVLAEKENEIIKSGDKRLIEIFRQDVSRELRIRTENESNM